MFRSLIGERFDRLPGVIRDIHSDAPRVRLRGRCDVERGGSPLSRFLGVIAMLPPAGRDVPIEVVIERDKEGETWTRTFGSHTMRSVLRSRRGALDERLGAVRFRFALAAIDRGIEWRLDGVRACGIPLPVRWFAGVESREYLDESRYRFEVRASLPVAGLLVHYQGWLMHDG